MFRLGAKLGAHMDAVRAPCKDAPSTVLTAENGGRVLTSQQLEIAAHGLTAVPGYLAGPDRAHEVRSAIGPVFAFLSLALVAWSSSVIIQRLSTSVSAGQAGHAVEELAAALIVPATAHFALIVSTEGRPSTGLASGS